MNTTDTINITRTTLTSRQADALGRGKPVAVTEAEFRKLMGIALTLIGDGSVLPDDLALAAQNLGDYFTSDDPTGAPDDYSLLGTFETAVQQFDINEVPEHLACPTCGSRNMDDLDASIDGQIECAICGTIYSDEGRWKRLPSGLTLYPAGDRWVTIPGAPSPAVIR